MLLFEPYEYMRSVLVLKLNEFTLRIVSMICFEPQLNIFKLLFESNTAILSL